MKRILSVFAAAFLCLAARGDDLQDLIRETQRVTQDHGTETIVWWIPSEFWELALRNNKDLTPEGRARFKKAMDDYLVLTVVSFDVTAAGLTNSADAATVKANTELLVDGKPVAPLTNEEISPFALSFISGMKPMMANMLGPLGKSMEFLVYPNPAKDTKKIEASKPGNFSYKAFGHQYNWRLPLGSLLPPKIDPKTNETFPGDYFYNPYTGDKLTDTPSPAPPSN